MFGEEDLISQIQGTPKQLQAMMLIRPVLAHPGFMMRGELITQEGFRYDESYRSAQDYNFAARVARKFNIGVTPEILLDYRVHKNKFPVKKRRTVKQRRQSAQHAAGMAGYFTG